VTGPAGDSLAEEAAAKVRAATETTHVAPAFVNPGGAYDRGLADCGPGVGDRLEAAPGVYAASSGPTYETEAEVAYLRRAGASVVGMSIVPEVSAVAALGMRFVGLYCVTNTAGPGTSHQEVAEVATAFAERLRPVIERVLAVL
jgi:purine-nucleoside phosphorylase